MKPNVLEVPAVVVQHQAAFDPTAVEQQRALAEQTFRHRTAWFRLWADRLFALLFLVVGVYFVRLAVLPASANDGYGRLLAFAGGVLPMFSSIVVVLGKSRSETVARVFRELLPTLSPRVHPENQP